MLYDAVSMKRSREKANHQEKEQQIFIRFSDHRLCPEVFTWISWDELNAQIIHQVIVIAAQFIFVLFFSKIIFDFIFVTLESSDDIRHFQFVDAKGDKK